MLRVLENVLSSDEKIETANSLLNEKDVEKVEHLKEENAELRRKLDEARTLIKKLARDSYNIAL